VRFHRLRLWADTPIRPVNPATVQKGSSDMARL
jgi:hypothetical protein